MAEIHILWINIVLQYGFISLLRNLNKSNKRELYLNSPIPTNPPPPPPRFKNYCILSCFFKRFSQICFKNFILSCFLFSSLLALVCLKLFSHRFVWAYEVSLVESDAVCWFFVCFCARLSDHMAMSTTHSSSPPHDQVDHEESVANAEKPVGHAGLLEAPNTGNTTSKLTVNFGSLDVSDSLPQMFQCLSTQNQFMFTELIKPVDDHMSLSKYNSSVSPARVQHLVLEISLDNRRIRHWHQIMTLILMRKMSILTTMMMSTRTFQITTWFWSVWDTLYLYICYFRTLVSTLQRRFIRLNLPMKRNLCLIYSFILFLVKLPLEKKRLGAHIHQGSFSQRHRPLPL